MCYYRSNNIDEFRRPHTGVDTNSTRKHSKHKGTYTLPRLNAFINSKTLDIKFRNKYQKKFLPLHVFISQQRFLPIIIFLPIRSYCATHSVWLQDVKFRMFFQKIFSFALRFLENWWLLSCVWNLLLHWWHLLLLNPWNSPIDLRWYFLRPPRISLILIQFLQLVRQI